MSRILQLLQRQHATTNAGKHLKAWGQHHGVESMYVPLHEALCLTLGYSIASNSTAHSHVSNDRFIVVDVDSPTDVTPEATSVYHRQLHYRHPKDPIGSILIRFHDSRNLSAWVDILEVSISTDTY